MEKVRKRGNSAGAKWGKNYDDPRILLLKSPKNDNIMLKNVMAS